MGTVAAFAGPRRGVAVVRVVSPTSRLRPHRYGDRSEAFTCAGYTAPLFVSGIRGRPRAASCRGLRGDQLERIAAGQDAIQGVRLSPVDGTAETVGDQRLDTGRIVAVVAVVGRPRTRRNAASQASQLCRSSAERLPSSRCTALWASPADARQIPQGELRTARVDRLHLVKVEQVTVGTATGTPPTVAAQPPHSAHDSAPPFGRGSSNMGDSFAPSPKTPTERRWRACYHDGRPRIRR